MFPVILHLHFLIEELPACVWWYRDCSQMVATLDILCEGIFLGRWASSSTWALSRVQLLLCWSHFSYGPHGWWVMSHLIHQPGGMPFVLWDAPPCCRCGRGWGQQKGSVLAFCVGRRCGAKMKVCTTSLYVTWISEVLGLDAKSSKFRQTNCFSSIADVLISICTLLCWLTLSY